MAHTMRTKFTDLASDEIRSIDVTWEGATCHMVIGRPGGAESVAMDFDMDTAQRLIQTLRTPTPVAHRVVAIDRKGNQSEFLFNEGGHAEHLAEASKFALDTRRMQSYGAPHFASVEVFPVYENSKLDQDDATPAAQAEALKPDPLVQDGLAIMFRHRCNATTAPLIEQIWHAVTFDFVTNRMSLEIEDAEVSGKDDFYEVRGAIHDKFIAPAKNMAVSIHSAVTVRWDNEYDEFEMTVDVDMEA